MSTTNLRILLFLVLSFASIAIFKFELHYYFDIGYLQARQHEFIALYNESPLKVSFYFFSFYVLVISLSFPGSAALSLLAGALFGLFVGTIIVSFASTIGATIAFLCSRFLFKDWVQITFKKRLQTMNEEFARDGIYYLFTLRLTAIVPFFLINVLMALTPIKARSFYWVSQLGMLPVTLVIVNAGQKLSQIESPMDIMSPQLLLSFLILGLTPLVTRKVFNRLKGSSR